MADSNKVGRPLKFGSVEELQKKIDEYFESCFEEVWYQDKDGRWLPKLDRNEQIILQQVRPYTITGLAVHLDTTRDTLLDYEGRDEFSDTIKKAKSKCELFAEEQLFTKQNVTGVIFNLKNNYSRWADKQEIDNNIANKDGKPFEVRSYEDQLKQLLGDADE